MDQFESSLREQFDAVEVPAVVDPAAVLTTAKSARRHHSRLMMVGAAAMIVVVGLASLAVVRALPGGAAGGGGALAAPSGSARPTTQVTVTLPDGSVVVTTGPIDPNNPDSWVSIADEASNPSTYVGSDSYPAGLVPNASTDLSYIVANPGLTDLTGVVVVDVWVDYLCPICAQAMTRLLPSLDQLMASGQVQLRYHLMTFLTQTTKSSGSTQAAVAASCADTVGAFAAYSAVLFAQQPPDETLGFTVAQLRDDFAQQAGIAGDNLTVFQACVDSMATIGFVTATQVVPANAGVSAVPTFAVNGHPVADWAAIPRGADAMLAYFHSLG